MKLPPLTVLTKNEWFNRSDSRLSSPDRDHISEPSVFSHIQTTTVTETTFKILNLCFFSAKLRILQLSSNYHISFFFFCTIFRTFFNFPNFYYQMFRPNVTIFNFINSSASHFSVFFVNFDCILVYLLRRFLSQISHLNKFYTFKPYIKYEILSHIFLFFFPHFLHFSALLLPFFQLNITIFNYPNCKASHFFKYFRKSRNFLVFRQTSHFLTLYSTFFSQISHSPTVIRFEKLSNYYLFCFRTIFRTFFAPFTVICTIVTTFSTKYHTLQLSTKFESNAFCLVFP